MCTIQKCLVVKPGNRLTSYCNYQKDFWSVCMHKLDICMYTRTHQAQDSWEFWLPLLVTFCFMILALNFLFVIPHFSYWKLCCRTCLMKAKCLLNSCFSGGDCDEQAGISENAAETYLWNPFLSVPLACSSTLGRGELPSSSLPWLVRDFSCSPVATHGFATCWGTYIESTLESC